MYTRIPLVATVVGALLIGGATTGTTHASWADSSIQGSSKVTSGRMAMSATVSATTVSVPRGESRSVSLTLKDDSPTLAKNLEQTLSATASSGSPSNVSASISASGGSCSGVALPQTVTPGQQRTSCVTVTAPANATPGQYTVTVVPAGSQSPSGGWRSVVSTVPITVTVTSPPAAPTNLQFSCRSGSGTTLDWSASGAVSYDLLQSTSPSMSSPSTILDDTTQTTFTKATSTIPGTNNYSLYFQVAATNSAGTTSSAVIRIRRNGSSNNFTCGAP